MSKPSQPSRPNDTNRATPSFADRAATSLLAAMLSALMVALVPIGGLIATQGQGVMFLGLYASVPQWGLPVVFVPTIAGFVLGSERAMSLFGHLWLTERPRNVLLTSLLWAVLILSGAIGYLVRR